MNPVGLNRRRFLVASCGLACLCIVAVWLKPTLLEEWYLRQLSAPDVESRRVAALKVSQLKSRRAVPVLLSMLGEEAKKSIGVAFSDQGPDRYVRDALARLGTLAVPALFDALSSATEEAAIDYIVDTLSDIGEASVPVLWKAVELPRAPARRAAIHGLWHVMEWEAWMESKISGVPLVVNNDERERLISVASHLVAQDENAEVRTAAAVVLGRIGPQAARALPILSKAARDADSELRYRAEQAVYYILASAHAYILALESQDEYLIGRAVHFLEFDPRQKDSIPKLREHLQGDDSQDDEAMFWAQLASYALRRFHGEDPGAGSGENQVHRP